MDPAQLRDMLEAVQCGARSVDETIEELKRLPFRDLGMATVDHHRALRQGAPEVILAEGKTFEQIGSIACEIRAAGQNVLITRLDPEKAARVSEEVSGMRYVPIARIGRLDVRPVPRRPAPPAAVVTAGTGDVGVAEEACETLDALGIDVVRVYDVGVAGIHRLVHRLDDLTRARAVVVVAGMEGALPSVVGGMIARPVVAVPTSVGYGTALGGLTALLSMLTSCASGVTVVNIDNGFGAAMAVHRMSMETGLR